MRLEQLGVFSMVGSLMTDEGVELSIISGSELRKALADNEDIFVEEFADNFNKAVKKILEVQKLLNDNKGE